MLFAKQLFGRTWSALKNSWHCEILSSIWQPAFFSLSVKQLVVHAGTRAHRYGLKLLGLLGLREQPRIAADHISFEMDGVAPRLGLLQPFLHLLLGIDGRQPEHEQIHGRGERGQPDQDEQNGQVVGQKVVLLERNVVAKAYGGQCDETVVDGVKVGPALVVHEHVRGYYDDGHAEAALHADQLEHADLLVFEAQPLLEPAQRENDE
ncbi:hypothetical protein BpHYR1_012354 [Brachionus plicatilis]|uniref:Uncharacterized protein n=1 Tax=Brachionus plicatilis TaxID=10195 RepID=A0A3M7Q511_BRAPC|nr:hypothetical protein BpHYR1_012354 [Brachionus plicatilis]